MLAVTEMAMRSALRLQRAREMPLQDRGRDRVGFLQVDAPILQFVERNAGIGNGATYIGSRRDHAEIAVQILHLRLAMTRGAEFIKHVELRLARSSDRMRGLRMKSIINRKMSAGQTHRFVMNFRLGRMVPCSDG